MFHGPVNVHVSKVVDKEELILCLEFLKAFSLQIEIQQPKKFYVCKCFLCIFTYYALQGHTQVTIHALHQSVNQSISPKPEWSKRSVDQNCIQNSPTGRFKFWSKILNKETNKLKYSLWSYLFVKNTTTIKISASQRIDIKNCMNYDHNKILGYLNFSRAIENYN